MLCPEEKFHPENFHETPIMGCFVSAIIQHTFNAIAAERMAPPNKGKFLQCIGLWILMVTVTGL